MKRLVSILYMLLVVVLAIATFVECEKGSAWVSTHIYHSFWFAALWGIMALLAVVIIARKRWWHKTSMLMFHASFVCILVGALITSLFGVRGTIYLTEGNSEKRFVSDNQHLVEPLPFTLRLDSFRIEHYAGTSAVADYISYLHVDGMEAKVSMNQILRYKGYRFCQASFDEDGQGSYLSVNHDPWGIAITYAGYLLLALSSIGLLLSPRGGFRKLLKHPLLRRGAACLLLCFLSTQVVEANELPTLSNHQTDSLARVQVVYQGRISPLATLAHDLLLKVYGEVSYRGLTPTQVVGGWMHYPDVWKEEPMIWIKDESLRNALGFSEQYVSFNQLHRGEEYRLASLYQQDERLQKAILQVDEKVGLLAMLLQGELVQPLTDERFALSDSRVAVELLYYRYPYVKWLFMVGLTLGFLSLFLLLSPRPCRRCTVFVRCIHGVQSVLLLCLFGARWYIAGRIPLTGGYETMLFVALCASLCAQCLMHRFRFMLSLGFLLPGFMLLVAHLSGSNPVITPLIPVLNSPWLCFHVSFIMLAYTLFGIMFVCSVLALFLPARQEPFMLFNKLLLYPATLLLGVGIFMGAIWANVSWGRYWAWDPKEVWALICFMVYGVGFHADSLPWLRRPKAFHLFCIFAFLTVLMTYFGVNLFMGGLHSYGK